MKTVIAAQIQNFALTPEEQAIFKTLLAANQMFRLGTTFRAAGGWTRDKLLGTQSDDLDIALDNLTGRQLEEKLLQMGAPYGVGKSYTVGVNVEKSKHLETVAIEIWGRKIDFVNLRSESYGDSRVPTMEFGTPQVDAERRDLTINSLFYNINTGQIEDFVGGMKDLETMTLRTPLNPIKTFMDDPLRMLRALRFFSRYPDSKLDPGMVAAMQNPQVQDSYRKKVASERAGPEITKLLAGAKPAEALRVMFDTGLDKAAFNVPETQNLLDLRMDQRNRHHSHNLLDHTLLVVKNMADLLTQENAPKDMRIKMLLAALFHDYGKAHPDIAKPKASDPSQLTYHGHEDKSAEISEAIMKSIAIPDDDRKFVNKVISLHMKPHLHSGETWTNRTIGRFMRQTEIPGQDSSMVWYYTMLHGVADTMSKNAADPDQADVDLKRQHIELMRNFRQRPNVVRAKPLLDGFALMKMFPLLKPNSGFLKDIGDRLLDEQGAGTIMDAAQAQAFVEGIRPEIEQKYTQGSQIKAWVQENCKFASDKE